MLKGKVFYPRSPRGEYSTTDCGGQLSTIFSNATEVAQSETPSCTRPQPDTDNGVRDGRSNRLALPPPSLAVQMPSTALGLGVNQVEYNSLIFFFSNFNIFKVIQYSFYHTILQDSIHIHPELYV